MQTGLFKSPDGSGLKKMLDAVEFRHKYISNNIANQNTPGYQAQDINFTDLLKNARKSNLSMNLKLTHEKHLPVYDESDGSILRIDGELIQPYLKWVDRSEEEEMINLAMNSISYKAASDLLARKYRMLSTAISGGK